MSLEAVAARAGVTRRTLYYHFASKDVLVAAYLKRRDQAGRTMLASAGTILGVFDALERWFAQREFRGCALTNAAGEDIVIAGTITARHKRAIRDWFIEAARTSGASDPVVLGESVMLLFDGALVAARGGGGPRAARRARSAAATLLGAAGALGAALRLEA